MTDLRENYIKSKENLGNISENNESLSGLTTSERLKFQAFESAKSDLNKGMAAYNFWKIAYLELFDKTIFSNLEMSVDPSFPYFECSHDNVEPGFYKLSIKILMAKSLKVLNLKW